MGIFDAAKDKIDDLRGEHGAEHEGFDAAKDKIDDDFVVGSDAGDDLGQDVGFDDEPADSGFVEGHDDQL